MKWQSCNVIAHGPIGLLPNLQTPLKRHLRPTPKHQGREASRCMRLLGAERMAEMICERCGGLVVWRGPLSALSHTQCESCGGINCQVYEPTPAEIAEYEAELTDSEDAYSKPPCQECGAMTPEEAETRCKCGGDKDDCHGCHLWP